MAYLLICALRFISITQQEILDLLSGFIQPFCKQSNLNTAKQNFQPVLNFKLNKILSLRNLFLKLKEGGFHTLLVCLYKK